MKQALVILSDRDADAPRLPAVATVSKDRERPDHDHGGWQFGVDAALAGRLWIDRPYFTGNPSPSWLVEVCRTITGIGGYCQAGNEQNHPVEGWQGGVTTWRAFWQELTTRYPSGNWLAMPPSPGIPGWQEWVTRDAPRLAVHAYGTLSQMQQIVNWYLANTAGELFITECNFGAGNAVDRNDWARQHLKPFLDWCGRQARVKFLSYFSFRWDQSHTLPTPVDAAGTEIITVLQNWQPTGGAMPLADVLLTEGEGQRAIRFNPTAALQVAINRDGFQIASDEFDVSHEGAAYKGQLAERLSDGAVRVYYGDLLPGGGWGGNVRHVQRGGQEFTIDDSRRSPNFAARPEGAASRAIVWHATAGPLTPSLNHLTSPTSGVSTHYLIAKDGRIFSLVPDYLRAFHAGNTVLVDGFDYNDISIGVELENANDGKDPYPPIQLEAAVWLAKKLKDKYAIPRSGNVTHAAVAIPRGRKTDPRGLDLERQILDRVYA